MKTPQPNKTLFPEWLEAHAADIRKPPKNQIATMWRRYGKRAGEVCGHCTHCVGFDYHNKTYYKCDLYAITHGAGSDWRKKWQACGKFEHDNPAA